MFYNSKIIKFDLIIYNVMNEKRRIFIKKNVIIFAYRNNKNK